MKSKVIVLIISLFLLSGCEAIYNVEINDNYIKDELIVNNYNVTSWNKGSPSYKNLIDNNYKSFNLAVDKDTPGYPEVAKKLKGYNYYDKKLINTKDNYGLKFSYNHKYNEYIKTPLLVFFGKNSIKNYPTLMDIDSGDGQSLTAFNSYNMLDKITINIKTNYLVKENNADKVNNNIYTWNLTKDNYQDKSIKIKIDKTKIVKDKNDNTDKYLNFLFIFIGIVVLLFIVLTMFKIRKSK